METAVPAGGLPPQLEPIVVDWSKYPAAPATDPAGESIAGESIAAPGAGAGALELEPEPDDDALPEQPPAPQVPRAGGPAASPQEDAITPGIGRGGGHASFEEMIERALSSDGETSPFGAVKTLAAPAALGGARQAERGTPPRRGGGAAAAPAPQQWRGNDEQEMQEFIGLEERLQRGDMLSEEEQQLCRTPNVQGRRPHAEEGVRGATAAADGRPEHGQGAGAPAAPPPPCLLSSVDDLDQLAAFDTGGAPDAPAPAPAPDEAHPVGGEEAEELSAAFAWAGLGGSARPEPGDAKG